MNERILSELQTLIEQEVGNFADVKGQESVKRALAVAAAGGRNIKMIGPLGAGKTGVISRIRLLIHYSCKPAFRLNGRAGTYSLAI